MSAITKPGEQLLEQAQKRFHPFCVICSRANECGLGLQFELRDDGSVEACFDCQEAFQGYEKILHGGITSSLLDGAMTNCLFAHGLVAVTAELKVKFRHPIEVGKPLVTRARIKHSMRPLHEVEAELFQEDQLKAKAVGKFMETEKQVSLTEKQDPSAA